jgi:hypothetical protein
LTEWEPLSTLDDLELFQIVPPLLEVLRRQGVDRLSEFQMSAVRTGLTKGESQILVTHDFDEAFEIAEISLLNTVATDFKARAVVLCPNPHQAERRYKSISQRCSRLSIPTSEIGRRRMAFQNEGAFGRVIVATYTAFDLASRLNPDIIKDVKCVLIDRLDLIGQPDIGARLETSLVTLLVKPDRQYIGICPPLENVADLSKWLSAEIVRDPKEDVNRVFGVKAFESPDDSLADLTEFVHARRGQIMVLCAGSAKSEELAEQLAGITDPDNPAVLQLELTPQQREKLKELAQNIIKPYPTCLTSTRLGVTLRRGIGFIHEGVSTIQRRTVTQAWESGALPVVVMPIRFAVASGLKATMVFLMGVFMEEQGDQKAAGQEMTMLTEWQMGAVLGATGRRGKDNDAFGMIIVDKESERTRVVSKYFRLDQKRGLIPREGEVDSVMDEPENIQDLVLMQLCGKRGSTEDPFSVISRTLWGSKNTVTDLSKFSEQADEPVERLLMQRATKTTVERAKEIPDSSVRLVSVRPDKIEGLVRSGSRELWHYVSLKAKDGVSCSCESWKFQGIRRHRLCKHLLKFSSFVIDQSDTNPYAAGVIRQALRGMEVFGELESDGLITRGKEGIQCTDIGSNTAYLGVPMRDAKRVMDAIAKEKGNLKTLLKQTVLARGRVHKKIVDEVLTRIPADSMEEVICEDHMPGTVENCIEEIEYMNSLLLKLMEKKHNLRKESEKLEKNLLLLLDSVR